MRLRSLQTLLIPTVLLSLLPATLRAQFKTPTLSGTISPFVSEYGDHSMGTNSGSGDGSQWYMTWDETDLHIAITGTNNGDGAIVYIDHDPSVPVDGGSNATGSLAGFNYDNTSFARLPFRADFVTYFKDGYREFRRRDGLGGWGGNTTGFGAYASSGDTREIRIPWSDITGGGTRPASFNWYGYLTSAGGFLYGPVPPMRFTGFVGTSHREPWYFTVDSTADGSSTRPFSLASYTFVNNGDIEALLFAPNYGAFADFTMNVGGRYFQWSADGSIPAFRDLIIGAGEFRHGGWNQPTILTRDLRLIGGRLTLGTAIGGDLRVARHVRLSPGAEFRCNARQVELNGNLPAELDGTFTGDNRIDFLRLDKPGNPTITMTGAVDVFSRLWLTAGILETNGNPLNVLANGADSANSGVWRGVAESGFIRGELRRRIGTVNGARQFPVGTSAVTPLVVNFDFGSPTTQGTMIVSTSEGVLPPLTTSNMVARQWHVAIEGSLGTYNANVSLQYLSSDLPISMNQNLLRAAKLFQPGSYFPHSSTWLDPTRVVTTNDFPVSSTTTPRSLAGTWILSTAQDAVLAVDLLSFAARADGVGSAVTLEWETAAEVMNAGFNVYRIDANAALQRLNSFPIPAKGGDSIGGQYTYVDPEPLASGESRAYLLEDVELSGVTTHHGPATVGPFDAAPSRVETWPMYGPP